MILLGDECEVGCCCRERETVSLVVDEVKWVKTYVEWFATGRTRRFECVCARTDVAPEAPFAVDVACCKVSGGGTTALEHETYHMGQKLDFAARRGRCHTQPLCR